MTERQYDSVWDALEDGDSLAENLKLRSRLMMAIAEYVAESGLTQTEAARKLGTTQPRLNDVIRGRIDKCTVDRLVNMLSQAGFRVDMKIHHAA
ncbi:MAG TPA: XRE family transcriptional regulator [Chromatiaceae bacterium]|nr:XRE family transcriptional regulator [Chromatiaceae bacterium]